MERKFRYGRWKIPEWNGMEDFKNGMENNLPYFHTRFCALYLQKNTYRCRVVINSIVAEVFNVNIYAYYLSTNRGTLIVYIVQTVYAYCIIVITLQFNCSIDVTLDDLDRFDLLFFYFEADNLPSRKFCFLTLSRKHVFAISSLFQLNFIYIYSF